ncbi:type IV toxin-antitoxin system AbiEi family antitoxin domain-containing protein [Pseudolysinimonas sp.]
MTHAPTMIPDVLIYVDEAEAAGGSGRSLRNACRRGLLVRVRRGAYCPRDVWDSLDPRDQHLLVVRAAIRRVRGPFLVAGASAAAVWRLPFAARGLDDVTLLVPFAAGGSSEPGVRRTCASWESAAASEVGGIPVTTRTRAVLDHSRFLTFGRAVAVVDAVRSRRDADPLALEALRAELDRARFSRGTRALDGVLRFSTSLSDSVGESETRAAIHVAGFETPELQRRWVDAEGAIETDYYWESVDAAGEFDGKVKYTRDDYTGGDQADVVWREKLREDRLRRQVRTVLRLVTRDVRDRVVLARLLAGAGIPRRGSR